MKLKVMGDYNSKPLTVLDESQQQRFIEKLKNPWFNKDMVFGIEIALIIMGYEIVKSEGGNEDVPNRSEG